MWPGQRIGESCEGLPNIEKAFPLDTQSHMEDALNAILVAEGKIA